MPSDNKSTGNQPFEIVTSGKSKKIGKKGIIVGVSIAIFLILSIVAGVLLVKQNQNVQEKAVVNNTCPGAEACPYPGQPNRLWSCHPADTDGTVSESLCSWAGRVETCGPATTQYCCPAAGAAWTTDMTACAVATPTPTPTPAPTATAPATDVVTATVTPTPTATATATATATGSQNACNGSCGNNSNCQSGLYCYSGSCRNPLCASDSTCGCAAATTTPTATATSTATTTSTTTQTTPLPIPVTGTNWPTVTGIGVGIGAIIVSILLAL